jgi:hypothetical protein
MGNLLLTASLERLKYDIERLREKLKRENNVEERWALQRLLFQQVYRIGFSRELIDCIENEIAEWKDWIEHQQRRVQRFEATARENRQEKRLLLLAQQTLAVHEFHRQRILMILAINSSSSQCSPRSGNGSPPNGRDARTLIPADDVIGGGTEH